MSDRRYARVNWQLGDRTNRPDGGWTVSNETVTHALLLDIRDQLDVLVSTLQCYQFQAIPRRLAAIEKNTRKKARLKVVKRSRAS